jgi:hypothetical protein
MEESVRLTCTQNWNYEYFFKKIKHTHTYIYIYIYIYIPFNEKKKRKRLKKDRKADLIIKDFIGGPAFLFFTCKKGIALSIKKKKKKKGIALECYGVRTMGGTKQGQ